MPGGRYPKGAYGHARHIRRVRLILMLLCFLFILTDVVFSLVIFQTRRTLFVIAACVMSIPFAKNLIGYLMAYPAQPLDRDAYEKAEMIGRKSGAEMMYDLTVTDTEGVLYFPCGAVLNNNLILYHRKAGEADTRKKIQQYLSDFTDAREEKVRVVSVSSLTQMEKELNRITTPKKEQKRMDGKIREKLLEKGF